MKLFKLLASDLFENLHVNAAYSRGELSISSG